MPDQEDEKLELKLKWPLEDGVQAVYANQFAISQTGPEIVIAFGEFLPVTFVNRSKPEVEEFLKSATVKPVAKVILSPAGLEAFYNLLKTYFEKNKLDGIS
jgi:hypothetical protein